MNPTLEALLSSWPYVPLLAAGLLLSAAIYGRGWLVLRRRDQRRWSAWRLASFAGGVAAIYLALASPLETFASFLLQVHMLQHLLLMMVAPPLLWLAWPLFPLLRGLPQPVRVVWAAPLLRSRRLQKLFAALTHPLVAGPIYVAATWWWHVPAAYELALRNDGWHLVEHASFFLAALLFWYPVVRPYPSRPKWSEWLLIPYLLLCDVQNTLLAAWLTFSSEVLYPHYQDVPRLFGVTALDDQATAGVLMWVPGSIAFLAPLFAIGLGLLFGRKPQAALPATTPRSESIVLRRRQPVMHKPVRRQVESAKRFDLIAIPLLGAILRWRFSRRAMQCLLLLAAVAVIYDGMTGSQASAMNLAGVLPWIHWRGLLILSLLMLGNVFCMACPFTLPRSLARRWLPAGRAWPSWLRSKWLAVGLVVLFLWSYETFALWDRPALTAWIALAYFAAAFIVDGLFQGAAFCKYVCPIGQFNFVQSLVSPLEVKVREPAACASCRTHECIRGSATSSGCQLQLFQPQKQGNFDCTFCLDCVHACPHDNVGILSVVPGATLWSDELRSGIGRLSARPDIAALTVVLVFGAFANAAGMVGPVVAVEDDLRNWLGNARPWLVTTLFFASALVVLPAILVGGAAVLCNPRSSLRDSITLVARYAPCLIPIGFAMWLAHYSFHFLTSYETVVPTTQRFAASLGLDLGEPLWQRACCRPVGAWLLHAELVALGIGLLGSLYAAWRIALADAKTGSEALRRCCPWCALVVLLFAAGVWILFQPMEMRGTLPRS